MSRPWTEADIPDLSGHTALVTGANSGLGKATARELAAKGCTVVMACRSRQRADAARADILQAHPGADLHVEMLDLARLDSVQHFAEHVQKHYDRLDVLVLNAGIMAIPRRETADGFETQFGVNVLGHFALAGRLLPMLMDTEGSRTVWLSSMAAWFGALRFSDLQGKTSYARWKAYNQSKLADLMLALEMNARLQAHGAASIALAAHPGLSNTDLQTTSVEQSSGTLEAKVESLLYGLTMDRLAMTADKGARPQLRAATDPQARGGAFYGPRHQMRGSAVEVNPPRSALSAAKRARLWRACESLTGVPFLSDMSRSV